MNFHFIGKITEAFKRHTRIYKMQIIDSKYFLTQLEASKSSIKDLLKDLLDEIKGLKYQLTAKVLLRKCKKNKDIEFV